MPPKKVRRDAPFVFVLVRMAGCGWCDRFEPTWNDLKKSLRQEAGLELACYERSDAELQRTGYLAHVKTFPTLLLRRPDGRVVVFRGERTAERIVAFLTREGAVGPRARG